jgi:plasmid stability protein
VRAMRARWPGTMACMRTAQIVDMSLARSNVGHMSKMIQIRNVPDDLHRELKMRAAAAGMTMSDYIKKELSWASEKDSWEEIRARAKARGPLGLSTQEVVDLIREGRGD